MNGEILMLLVYVSGFAELLVLLITYFILRKRKNEPKLVSLNRALLITSIIGFGLWFVINFAGGSAPLKPLQYLLMGGWAYDVLRKNQPLLLKMSLPVAVAIFYVFIWQFTFVHKKVEMAGTWTEKLHSSDEVQPGQVLIMTGCQGTGFISPELLAYLKSSGKENVNLTFYSMYHYGKLAGYNLDSIDGRKFPDSRSWSTSVGNCHEKIFPDYYFGIRGLTFSQMYEGWKP